MGLSRTINASAGFRELQTFGCRDCGDWVTEGRDPWVGKRESRADQQMKPIEQREQTTLRSASLQVVAEPFAFGELIVTAKISRQRRDQFARGGVSGGSRIKSVKRQQSGLALPRATSLRQVRFIAAGLLHSSRVWRQFKHRFHHHRRPIL